MMGWVALALLALATYVALRLIGLSRSLGGMAAAALMLGAAGYAWQQHAALAAHPVAAAVQAIEVDPGMVAFRTMILPVAPDDSARFAAADDHLRRGEPRAAVDGFLRAIAQRPDDAALWTGLGTTLAAHDGGQVSPAARFAFRRAWQLAPDAPGPPFFLGLAYVQAGDLDATRTAWLRALILTPRDAPYRVDIAERLVLIDQFQAMAAAARSR